MQITATYFKQLAVVATEARVKHNNFHCSFFSNTREALRKYAQRNATYANVLTKPQQKTVMHCILFEEYEQTLANA